MSAPDSQWLRYEVFKQDRPGRPHQNVGSVHAPDAELALQNARDVFARRPSSHSLWVVPVDVIVEQAGVDADEGPPPAAAADTTVAGRQPFAIFAKQSQRQGMTYVEYVGELEGLSAATVLRRAPLAFPQVAGIVWWACPVTAIVCSQIEDVESMFHPANDKRFRMPNEYRTVFTMQKMKRGDGNEA